MKLVIFDCDGTLVDSQHIIVESATRALTRHGYAVPPRRDILAIVGLSLPQALGRLVGHDRPDIPQLVEAYKAAFHEVRAEEHSTEPLYPGARAALDTLHARADVRLAVATGKSQRGVKIVCETHGLEGYFASIQTADDAPSKPHPGMIHQALAETGVDAADAVMVGDTTYDMDMAHAAGITPVGVSWGYHSVAQLKASGADIIIDHFDELLPLLGRLWGQG